MWACFRDVGFELATLGSIDRRAAECVVEPSISGVNIGNIV